jgi:hypothetical protein
MNLICFGVMFLLRCLLCLSALLKMSLGSLQGALKKVFRQSLALGCAEILSLKRRCFKSRSLLALLPQVLVWCQ